MCSPFFVLFIPSSNAPDRILLMADISLSLTESYYIAV